MPQALAVHTFPPSTRQLERKQKTASEILTRAYRYVCDRFPCALSDDEQKDNLDARNLLLSARDAVYSQTELFLGDTFAAAERLVDESWPLLCPDPTHKHTDGCYSRTRR